MAIPSKEELVTALKAAAAAHHEYQQSYLEGNFDRLWSGFYAAYLLGRLGPFIAPSRLSILLEQIDQKKDWNTAAAEAIFTELKKSVATGAREEEARRTASILYVCPHCFTASETAGTCEKCGFQRHEFRPGDVDDPCRCPVLDSQGELLTHAPLWWLRSVAPELAEKMEKQEK